MSTLYAYVTPYGNLTGRDVWAESPDALAEGLAITSIKPDNTGLPGGWVHVGTAEVHVTLMPRDAINAAAAEARARRIAEAEAQLAKLKAAQEVTA